MSIAESKIRDEVLRELAASSSGEITISDLIDQLEIRLSPSGKDAQIADGRSDTYFSQKVRNTVSHRQQGTGLAARGLAKYNPDRESWTITAEGIEYVAAMEKGQENLAL